MPSRARLHVTSPARRDIAAIVKWRWREFGEATFESDPERLGSKERPEFMRLRARVYHPRLSRNRVSGPPVAEPRHFILYRRRTDVMIEVARVIHESRNLERRPPES